MPSLIPGFEYDIFISYRHKDNKYDGWVSEFVSHLKSELEATFKDEVSVYFDANPHDGLLETHNVDKSLENKLKCLIMIPIVSQTYCDPKSFAWQHEFCVFNKKAKEDSFGRDIKLANGNVASRILPVKIHNLDQEDKATLEEELGGVLRCIEFIYRSAGVNRPLKPNDDRAQNSNHTYYRDQINKVANAVKEIVQGIAAGEKPVRPKPKPGVDYAEITRKKIKVPIWVSLLVLTLVLASYYGFTNWIRQKEVTAIRNGSIAILPFENQTGRNDLNSIGQVASDFISTKLIQNQFWKVIPTQDVFRQTVYSGVVTNPEAEKKILDQSQLDFIVLGHYNLIGDSVLLVASVNDVIQNKVLYTTPIIKCITTNPMKAVNDAQQFILGFLMFSSEKQSTTTRPPKYDAYQAYLKGMELWTKSNLGPGNIFLRTGSEIEDHFMKSISLDPDFLPPYFKLAELFSLDRKINRLDSILRILETKQKLFLEGDNLNYNIQKLLLARDYDALERFLLSKTEVGSSDFRPYFLLGVNALYRQNKARKALEYLNRCDLKEFDFENKTSDQSLFSVKASALMKLNRYEDVVALIDGLGFKIKQHEISLKRWQSLYFLGKIDQVEKELGDYLSTAQPDSYGLLIPSISIFRAAQLRGDTASMDKVYRQFKEYIQGWDERAMEKTFLKFAYAVMMYRAKDNIEEAERLLQENLPIVDRPRRIHQLGLLYAATGREAKANEIIGEILAAENQFNSGIIRYYAAKIEAELGHKEKSVDYLRQSIARGNEYREDLYQFDGDLGTLLDYPPFIELVTPKE